MQRVSSSSMGKKKEEDISEAFAYQGQVDVPDILQKLNHDINKSAEERFIITKEEYYKATSGVVELPAGSSIDRTVMKRYRCLLGIRMAYGYLPLEKEQEAQEEECFEVIDIALRVAAYIKNEKCLRNLFEKAVWVQEKQKNVYAVEKNGIKYLVSFQRNETEFKFIWYSDYGHLEYLAVLLKKTRGQIPLEILESALSVSAARGHKKIVQFLLALKAEEVSTDVIECIFSEKAAARGHTEVVRFLLENEKISISVKALEKALFEAAYANYSKVVTLLLEKKPQEAPLPLLVVKEILLMVAKLNHTEIMVFLLEHQRAQITNETIGEPFVVSVAKGSMGVLYVLFKKHREGLLHIPVDAVREALIVVTKMGNKKMLVDLLDAPLPFPEGVIEAVLLTAVMHAHTEIVRYILEEKEGYLSKEIAEKALIKAADHQRTAIIQLLVESGIGRKFSFFHKIWAVVFAFFQGRFHMMLHFFWPAPRLAREKEGPGPLKAKPMVSFKKSPQKKLDPVMGEESTVAVAPLPSTQDRNKSSCSCM